MLDARAVKGHFSPEVATQIHQAFAAARFQQALCLAALTGLTNSSIHSECGV